MFRKNQRFRGKDHYLQVHEQPAWLGLVEPEALALPVTAASVHGAAEDVGVREMKIRSG